MNQELERDAAPSLCIGMPVYNGEEFIVETLDSVLAQTYTDFEVVILDNASTDRTPEIIADYAARDDRIRVIRQEQNLGAAANFNQAFDECRSEFFKWCAVDDPCAPEFFERCIDALRADPDAVLAYPETAFIDEHSRILYSFEEIVDMPDWSTSTAARGRQVFDALLRDGSTANVIVFGVMRAELMRGTRRLGGYFGSDLPMMADIVLQGNVIEVPGAMSFLRRHQGSSSTYDRAPSARSQQDFYDPSVSGRLKLEWNLRRRYWSLLEVAAGAPTGPLGKLSIVGAYLGSVLRRLGWRAKFEIDVRRGTLPPPPRWENDRGSTMTWQELLAADQAG
ncbi:MAG: glycosyltransferase family 2 protein [Actinomycetota bacterium]